MRTLVTAFKAAAVEFFFAYFIETEMTINENKRRGDLGKPVAQNFFLLSSFRFVVANLILLINYNFFPSPLLRRLLGRVFNFEI